MQQVVIIGAGKVGQRHIEAYRDVADATIAGIVEPDDSSFDSATSLVGRGVRRFASIEDAIANPDVDVVDICTPTPEHASQVIAALRAGKQVFCEKPLTMTLDDIQRIAEVAENSTSSLRIGYVYRHHPRVQKLKARLDAGVLGDPLLAVFRIGGRGSHRLWKHERVSGGGAFLDMASHMLDLAIWFFGPFKEADVLLSRLLAPLRLIDGKYVKVDAEDLVITRASAASGSEIIVIADFVSPGFANAIDVSGENGTASVSILSGLPDRYVLTRAAGGLPAGETLEPGDEARMLQLELSAFLADLEAGRQVVDLDSSMQIARLLDERNGLTGG